MKIICLMSGQLLPNYQLVKHLTESIAGWHEVLCLHSESMTPQLAHMQLTIKKHLPQLKVRVDESLFIERVDHVAPTERLVTTLLSEAVHETWIVNCAGGTKMMSGGALLAARAAKDNVDVRALYIDFDEPGSYVDAFSGETQPMPVNLSVSEYLDLYGITVPQAPGGLEGERLWEPFCVAWCARDPRVLPVALPNDAVERRRTLEVWRTQGHDDKFSIPWSPKLDQSLREMALGLFQHRSPTDWQMRLLTGDLLDNFVYAALWRYADKLDISEVRRWVRSSEIGEVDLCVVRGGALVLIECKAGRQAGPNFLEQIAKLDLRRQRIGAKKSRSMLISSGENLFGDWQETTWHHDVLQSVNRGSIQVIARPHIRRLAQLMRDEKHEEAITILKDWLDGGLPELA